MNVEYFWKMLALLDELICVTYLKTEKVSGVAIRILCQRQKYFCTINNKNCKV